MNKVYVLMYCHYENTELIGVYSTEEKAEERRQNFLQPSLLYIDEIEVDA